MYRRSYIDIQKKHSAELMMLLTEDSASVSGCFTEASNKILADIALCLGSVVFMFWINWQLALLMSVVIPVMTLVMNMFASNISRAYEGVKDAEESVRKNLQEAIIKMPIFKAYSMIDWVINRHHVLYKHKSKAAIKNIQIASIHSNVNTAFNFGLIFITYGIGSLFILNGSMTIGGLIGISTLMGNIGGPFMNVSTYISAFAESSASARRIREVIELPCANEKTATAISQISKLEIKNVDFSYHENRVLRDLSFEAKLGDIIGIIGESGSGKSTLTKLLLGYYEPDSGTIELTATSGITTDNILPYVSYVPSDNLLFNGSIVENICMSNHIDTQMLEHVAKAAGIHSLIASLPQGFDTIVGESSNTLSSGQAQRIGIARALYHNAPILIFDEPTSNLDSDSAEILHETIKDISHDKICLIVTHNQYTQSICDKIYIIDNGYCTEKLNSMCSG